MVAAIVLGAVFGLVGFLPLFGGLRLTRRTTSTSNVGPMAALLLGVIVSFVVLLGGAFGCIMLARDMVLPFVGAEVVVLIVVAVAYGFSKLVRK